MCAASVGAFHIRQRLWFIGRLAKSNCNGYVSDRPREKEEISGEHRQEVLSPRQPSRASDSLCPLADALSPGIGGGDQRGLREEGREVGEQKDGAGVADELGNGCEDAGGVADSGDKGLEIGSRGSKDTGASEKAHAAVELCGPSNFWSTAEWFPCRDGKLRPTEPGLCPLAHGISADLGCLRPGEVSPYRVIRDPKTGRSLGQTPWRVGMLKGYGNAIVPEVGAEFIRAYLTPPSKHPLKKRGTLLGRR